MKRLLLIVTAVALAGIAPASAGADLSFAAPFYLNNRIQPIMTISLGGAITLADGASIADAAAQMWVKIGCSQPVFSQPGPGLRPVVTGSTPTTDFWVQSGAYPKLEVSVHIGQGGGVDFGPGFTGTDQDRNNWAIIGRAFATRCRS